MYELPTLGVKSLVGRTTQQQTQDVVDKRGELVGQDRLKMLHIYLQISKITVFIRLSVKFLICYITEKLGGGGAEQCSIDKKSKGCWLTPHKIRYSQLKITSIVHFLIIEWNFA